MKAAGILIGVVALVSAAPATTQAKTSSVSSAGPVSSSVSGTQEGDWHIGCDKGDKDHKNHKCSFYRGTATGVQPRSDDYAIHPKYTSTHPDYKPSTTYTDNTPSTTYPHYKATSFGPSQYTLTHPSYTSSSNVPPTDTSSSPRYQTTTSPRGTTSTPPPPGYQSTVNSYEKPLPSYNRRGDYDPIPYTPVTDTQYKPAQYGPSTSAPSQSEYTPTPTTAPYEKPNQPEGPHSGKPQGPQGDKPQAPQGNKPGKPTSPPFCDFVDAECIDCNAHPEDCDTCNFIFKCGQKKQCSYHGFRETMTLCQEKGEECPWPWSDNEYDAPEDKPVHPQGTGDKPNHPQGENNKPEQSPKGGDQPHGPKGGDHPQGPKGGDHPQGPNGGDHPQGPKESIGYSLGPLPSYGPSGKST